ncbi:restriction endonuclease [Lysobacter niastensis]|uniref:Restriction endonuclease n=1 Tax=Lysobacter niastensis TaxID=380629 RepID=A0ABS0B4C2_9GAMM|nr:restriction endonuclease [Lysobacter niastensis]MBF6023443.1 restriction endonuclease [Lysobacter niastensis]
MGRRKQNGLELIASLPWPVGIVLGILAFVGIRYGLGWYFTTTASHITQQVGRQMLSSGMLAPIAWIFLAICWFGALLSWLGRRKRKQLLATQTGLDNLRAMTWREFEMLVGEAFRRRDYAVEETGLGGADGGIDLILRKDGRKELVQCKQWRSMQVGVSVVREMWGLANHHSADGAKIVSVGDYTRDAIEFARDKQIELISAPQLLEMIRSTQMPGRHEPSTETTSGAPSCPSCSAAMVLRRNKASGQSFWGCGNYPNCRGTRAMKNLL